MAKIMIHNVCMLCNQRSSIAVDEDKWNEYLRGRREGLPSRTHSMQAIFPNLTPGEREMLISGSHEECFDKAFGTDDE